MLNVDLAAVARLVDALDTLLQQVDDQLKDNAPREQLVERVHVARACTAQLSRVLEARHIMPLLANYVDEGGRLH